MKNCHCRQYKKRRNHSLNLKRSQRRCPDSRLHDLQNSIDKKNSDGYKGIYLSLMRTKDDGCDVFGWNGTMLQYTNEKMCAMDQHTLSLAGWGVKAHARCSSFRHSISRCCRCFCLCTIGLALGGWEMGFIVCTCQSLLA